MKCCCDLVCIAINGSLLLEDINIPYFRVKILKTLKNKKKKGKPGSFCFSYTNKEPSSFLRMEKGTVGVKSPERVCGGSWGSVGFRGNPCTFSTFTRNKISSTLIIIVGIFPIYGIIVEKVSMRTISTLILPFTLYPLPFTL